MGVDDLLDDPVYNPDIAIGRQSDFLVILFSNSFWVHIIFGDSDHSVTGVIRAVSDGS